MTNKSPFFVIEDFLSPKVSDQIVDALNIQEPDTNPNEEPIKSVRFSHHCESIVFDRLEDVREQIEQHFGFSWKGTEEMTFEFVPEDCVDTNKPMCGNSVFNKKWIRNNTRDFTGVIFLSDYNDGKEEFDESFEVFGGKLQFPQHHFSFNPQRGTLVVFPAGPHFIHSISQVHAGDLYMVKFHIVGTQMWLYDHRQFPGSYKTWF